jgi:hypothetical protein
MLEFPLPGSALIRSAEREDSARSMLKAFGMRCVGDGVGSVKKADSQIHSRVITNAENDFQ